ncbi:MAG: hypothetical protein IT514_13925 [Burkholderiales bacterium]|nr:hypothetical protein [Burkholderiales bacterium]
MAGRLSVQAYLTAACLRVGWTAGLRGGLEIREEPLAGNGSAPRWLAAVEALENRVKSQEWRRFDLRVLIGDENVRYALLPSLDARLGVEELSRLAHSLLVRTYGESAQEWSVRLSAAGRNAVLVAAIDNALLHALEALGASAEARLRSAHPAFLRLAELAGGFTSREHTWMLAFEPSAAVAGLWERSDLLAVRVLRAWSDASEIGPWLERERLRTGSEVRQVLVCGEAPADLRFPAGWSPRESRRSEPLLQRIHPTAAPRIAA